MGVEYSSPDLQPYLVALWECDDCRGLVDRYGLHVADPPRDWVAVTTQDGSVRYVCPGCVPEQPVPAN